MHVRSELFWKPWVVSGLLVLACFVGVASGQNPPANAPAADDAAAKAAVRELNAQLGEFQKAVKSLSTDIRRARAILLRGSICTSGPRRLNYSSIRNIDKDKIGNEAAPANGTP